MKTNIRLNPIARAIFIFLLILMPFSCGKKPLPTETTKEIINNSTSMISEVDRNSAIIDSLKIYIGKLTTGRPECDSICQVTIDKLLMQLNNRKQSGDNSFGVYYDKYQKMLVAYAKLAETVNKKVEIKESKDRFFLKETKIPVPANFSKEERINLWVGRFFWLILLVVIVL